MNGHSESTQGVVTRPESLHHTRNAELAAALVTLGFPLLRGEACVVRGDGVEPEGRCCWRFGAGSRSGIMPLNRALEQGLSLDPPVENELAVIAVGFHNKRMLVERVQRGTHLRPRRRGSLWILHRDAGGSPPDILEAGDHALAEAAGTINTELAAALVTLGFLPTNAAGPTRTGIDHGKVTTTWYFGPESADGRYQLDERLARWHDDAWMAREENRDPLACVADAFWNLRELRKRQREAVDLIQVKNGIRTVLMRNNASDALWRAAEDFLNK